MLLTLYDSYGNVKARIAPDESSTQDKEIQGDNLLKLSFTLYEFVPIDVNDYVDYGGERYWAVEKYVPAQKSTVEWEYSLQLYGIESLIKRFLVLNNTDGGNEAVFTLTGRPVDHVRLIVKNINDGMDGTTNFKAGAVEGTENVVIDYTGKYCHEALKELAEAVGTEWWFDGETLNLCRCEHGEEVALGYDKGLTSLDRDTADGAKFYTRLFPIGSTRNIDPEKYGHSRLMLPDGAQYVDVNVEKYGIIHHYEQSAFADIYPRRVGVVGSVRHEEVKDKDGKPFTIYYFRDNDLPFDPNDYEIGGLVKRVSFQEGSELAGLGTDNDHYFEVNFNSDTKEFEIITIWPYDDDTQLPGGTLVPKAGDKYILWNIRMPDEYYGLAEKELRSAVDEYNRRHALDVSRYKAPTDHVWMEDTGTELFIGRRIRLESKEYFPETGYRQSRITRISRKVNLPGQMDLEISDALSTGAMAKIDDAIAEAKNYAGTMVGSINVPDIIRSWESTKATDSNLFSARRIVKEFLSKFDGGEIQGPVTLLKGIVAKAKSFFAGIENIGDIINSGTIKTNGLIVTGLAHFFKLVIDQIKSIGGAYISSPADGFEIDKVEALYETGNGGTVRLITSGGKYIPANGKALAHRQETAVGGVPVRYRLYWRATDGRKTRVNMWKVGDQALSMDFNNAQKGVATDVANNYWWSCVLDVSSEPVEVEIDDETYLCHYIEVSNEGSYVDGIYTAAVNTQGWDAFNKTKGAPMWTGALKPAAGDAVTMLGHRFTSATDKDKRRQSAIYESSYASIDKEITPPLKAYYKGIDDFNLEKHRGTYDDAYGSEIVGSVKIVSKGSDGETVTTPIDEYITEKASGSNVQYALTLSPSIIHVGQEGTMSADRVTPRVTKLEGDKGTASWSVTEAESNGLSVAYRTSRMGSHVYLHADYVSVAENVDYIEFVLVNGSGYVDIKSIPVVRDGKDGVNGNNGIDGTDGTDGKDGEDAYEVVCDPQVLVFDTDDSGTLENVAAKTVNVSLRRKGLPVDITGKVSVVQGSCVNVDPAGVSVNVGTTVTVDPEYIDSDEHYIASTSASFMIAIDFDNRTYYATILISVNVTTYMSRIESDARQYKRDFDLFKGNETNLEHFRTGLLQTAREISLEATEAEERRNMLTGTAFRRLEEVEWNNPNYPCMISKTDSYKGTNALLIDCDSASDIFKGVAWKNVKVTPGKTYTFSFWSKGDPNTDIPYFEIQFKDGIGNNISAKYPDSGIVLHNTAWSLTKTSFTTPAGADHISVLVYIINSGKMCVARPMLEEGDEYNGWTLSERDDDYIGGNIIAGTKLLSGGNISLPSGAVRTENGFGDFAVVSKSNGSGGDGLLNATGLVMFAQKEYILSLMLKGSGKLSVNWGHGVYFAESSDGQESIYTEKNGNATQSGYIEIEASSDWRMVYVHIRTMATDVPNLVYLGSAGGTYNLSVAALKLEEGATVTEWTDSTKTISFPHGTYGAYIRETARQIEMSVTDGVNQAGLLLGADGGFKATARNFWFVNRNGELVLALTEDGQLKAEMIEAHRVSAWNIAQPFETYASLDALISGSSLSWVIKTAGDYSQLLTNTRMNGTVLNVLNVSSGVVTFRILFVGLTDKDPANSATVRIPKLTMFRAVGVPVDIPGSSTQIAFYCLVPYIVSGTTVTVQRPSFKKITIGGMQRPILEEH